MDWQPIETAPKNGTWILVAFKRNTYDPWPTRTGEAIYTGRCPYWRIHGSSYHPSFVTHWAPLPEPPAKP